MTMRHRSCEVGLGSMNYGYWRVAYGLPVRDVRYRKVPYVPWKLLSRAPTWQNTYLFMPFPRVDLFHLWNGISLTRSPWICSFEANLPRYMGSKNSAMHRIAMERLHSASCRRLLALSDFARHFFISQHGSDLAPEVAAKTEVFYGGVEVKLDRLVAREARAFLAHAPTLCFVGHDFFQKGGIPTLRAYQLLRKSMPGLRLIVVSRIRTNDFVTSSTESDRADVIEAIRSDVGIEWHEELPHDAVLDVMARSDIGLLPTLDDTFGWSAVEFMSVGLPVIASNVCAMPEIVNSGTNGITVALELQANRRWMGLTRPQGTIQRREAVENAWNTLTHGLVEAVQHMLSSEDRLRSMSRAAAEHVAQTHSPVDQARRLENIYEACR